MRADRFAGPLVLLAGVALCLGAAGLDVLPDATTLSARAFPYGLAVLLMLGGGFLTLRPGEGSLSGVLGRLADPRTAAFAGLFLLYALTFRFVDFRVGTWAFMLAAMWVLGARSLAELVLLPLGVAGAVYVLFRHGFTVLLPVWF